MSWLGHVFWPLVYAAIMVGCIYWANLFYRDARLQERLNLPKPARLFAVLALAGLVYSPVSRIVLGFLNVLGSGTILAKLSDFVGAAAIVAILFYLFVWLDKENPS